ncbi:very low-density lipoprotein receptor-like [Zophobas morio]|uniref:very low-density lipoprotein receptor-like n=1 Tax=Zophobas morio TaxID=2755281 RepID=UPI003082EDA7
MILQPTTVELTKIHFYNREIPTISREIFDNQINNTVVIKKNLFRHKWVLKINEIGGGREKFQWRLVVYVLGLSCLVVAVVFGLYFTFGRGTKRVEFGTIFTFVKETNATEAAVELVTEVVPTLNLTTHEKQTRWKFCQNCTSRDHICLKQSEVDIPQCVQPLDKKDPTGCGGFCSINTQFCQLLDNQSRIFQCSNLKNTLKCPRKTFNCGNMCINEHKRCDGIIHCSNKIDEMNCDCNLDTHFRCGNVTSCLLKLKKCDGFVDCWDKSDEIDCKQGCKNNTIPCLNGDCIPKENFCDGKYHCPDRSDEPQGCQL